MLRADARMSANGIIVSRAGIQRPDYANPRDTQPFPVSESDALHPRVLPRGDSSGARCRRILVAAALVFGIVGCAGRPPLIASPSPVQAGGEVRNFIGPEDGGEAEAALRFGEWETRVERVRSQIVREAIQSDAEMVQSDRNVLYLSGGGALGAYSAGVLYGWSRTGTRPEFQVVTGISTGALIAPFAFLGPQCDEILKDLYTTVNNRDLFRLRPIRGLLSESFSDITPMARRLDAALTPELVDAIGREHRKGRRLYAGTTDLESQRFVVWDLGAIAARGRPQDRELLKQVCLGSAAIPGLFPPSHIRGHANGREMTERHVDGGVSRAIFFRPPVSRRWDRVPEPLAGTKVWCVVAGKLFDDPEPVGRLSLNILSKSASGVLYAQTRGDLARLWADSAMSGMEFRMTTIPADYPGPLSSKEFSPALMRPLFEEGVRQALAGANWRTRPPGAFPGERDRERSGIELTSPR